jgi:hypothetical protein
MTHMETLRRVWFRRLAIAALLVGVIGSTGLGASFAYALLSEPVTAPALPGPPPHALADASGAQPAPEGEVPEAPIIQPLDIPSSASASDDGTPLP